MSRQNKKTVDQLFEETFKPITQPREWMNGYQDAEAGIPHKGQTGDYERGYNSRMTYEANMGAVR